MKTSDSLKNMPLRQKVSRLVGGTRLAGNMYDIRSR